MVTQVRKRTIVNPCRLSDHDTGKFQKSVNEWGKEEMRLVHFILMVRFQWVTWSLKKYD